MLENTGLLPTKPSQVALIGPVADVVNVGPYASNHVSNPR